MGSEKNLEALVPPDGIRAQYADRLSTDQALAIEALFTLRTTVQSLDNAVSRWLGADALSPGRLQLLAVLWSRKKPVPQREIVTTLKVSRATVSGLINALLAENHIVVTPDADDRRQMRVALTPMGKRMTERLIRENASRLRQTFGALENMELRVLLGLLGKLVGAL